VKSSTVKIKQLKIQMKMICIKPFELDKLFIFWFVFTCVFVGEFKIEPNEVIDRKNKLPNQLKSNFNDSQTSIVMFRY